MDVFLTLIDSVLFALWNRRNDGVTMSTTTTTTQQPTSGEADRDEWQTESVEAVERRGDMAKKGEEKANTAKKRQTWKSNEHA